ncbi:carboxy-terminal processing protease [Bacteroides reticulotermitis JCM 10512]|uniref:Carboxy-terminal processing protease n=1 Tax=Bacteroides reticulotermitis JCM 10512 TaxID=1445607 RepID=W4URF1_9BACE|nr:carboxy-terminal processing protease [Bacteroides reticulotermitis JCM 10512]
MKKYLLVLFVLCGMAAQAQNLNSPALRKLQMAEFAISHFYVDEVNEDKLVEEAIIKMLAQLDPHSTYQTLRK